MKIAKTFILIFIGLIFNKAASIVILAHSFALLTIGIITSLCLQLSIKIIAFNNSCRRLYFNNNYEPITFLTEKYNYKIKNNDNNTDELRTFFCKYTNKDVGVAFAFSDNDLCNYFNNIYDIMKPNGQTQSVKNIENNLAGLFLLDICKQIFPSPLHQASLPLQTVSFEDLNGERTIVYSFNNSPNFADKNVTIHLVLTKYEKIRLFTVKTSLWGYALYEYADGNDINYGIVELENVSTKIIEILKK